MGVSSRIEPLYIVLTQLKTLIAVGMATPKVANEKKMAEASEMPATNM